MIVIRPEHPEDMDTLFPIYHEAFGPDQAMLVDGCRDHGDFCCSWWP